jgi:hypothetical protein
VGRQHLAHHGRDDRRYDECDHSRDQGHRSRYPR